jgi:hypothetical protein
MIERSRGSNQKINPILRPLFYPLGVTPPLDLYMDPIWIIRGGLSILSLDKIDNPWIILGSSSVADRVLIGCKYWNQKFKYFEQKF